MMDWVPKLTKFTFRIMRICTALSSSVHMQSGRRTFRCMGTPKLTCMVMRVCIKMET